jgi:uroporphyrin-III C-methyltransferase
MTFSALPDELLARFDLPAFAPGSVWLVGAGPGDPGLLSMLALHGIRHADSIVYDALVDERVLSLARPEAEKIYAGKRGGKPSPKQPDISDRLIRLARGGQRVLRLKGGDPFVFGRGGEEALALVAAGVPFRVVPGISSGIGGLAYAGIPVTLGDGEDGAAVAAVALVTGHASNGEVPDGIDWAALARGAPTLVLYMALKHLEPITERLLAGGRSVDDPVALVSRAATAAQRVLETTLGRAVADAAAAGIEPPAIVIIGAAVRQRRVLDWLASGVAGELPDVDGGGG